MKTSWWKIRWAIYLAVLFLAMSCASSGGAGHGGGGNHSIPDSLQSIDHGLGLFILLSVLALAGSAASFFLLPAGHRLSLSIAVAAGSLLVISLILKVTLWLVPLIIIGLVGLAAIALIYEVVYKIKHGKFDVPGDGEGNL